MMKAGVAVGVKVGVGVEDGATVGDGIVAGKVTSVAVDADCVELITGIGDRSNIGEAVRIASVGRQAATNSVVSARQRRFFIIFPPSTRIVVSA